MERKLKQITAAVIVLMFICVAFITHGESDTWDCPECGRPGNTGNYCGGCAHPAPWVDINSEDAEKLLQENDTLSETIKISDVQYLGKGMVKVICVSGSDEDVNIVAYHYFNDSNNVGIDQCYQLSYCEADHLNNSYVLYGFIPGRRYWIKASTNSSTVWYDISIPIEKQDDIKVTVNKIELIKLVNWSEKKKVKQFSAKEIEATCSEGFKFEDMSSVYYAFNEQFSIGKYKGDKDFVLYHALKMPNGDIVTEETMTIYQWPSGTSDGLSGWLWDRVYSAYGHIPTGEYSYIVGFENYAEKEVSFTVTE